MKHKKYIAILLLAGIIVVGLIFLWRGTGTFYHGHRLSWWVDQYSNRYNPGSTEAMAALSAIGTNSVPYLINLICHVDDAKPPTQSAWDHAWAAAGAFSVLGTNAKPYIPELKALVANHTNGAVCIVAENALASLGPDGFAAVMDVIAQPNLPQRGGLLQETCLFAHMLPTNSTIPGMAGQDPNFRINAIRAAPILLKCLGDNDVIVRNHAVSMLSYSDPGVMVPALTNFLVGSPPLNARRLATQALAMHGSAALDAVPFLHSRYSNSDQEICIEASNALAQIAPGALAH